MFSSYYYSEPHYPAAAASRESSWGSALWTNLTVPSGNVLARISHSFSLAKRKGCLRSLAPLFYVGRNMQANLDSWRATWLSDRIYIHWSPCCSSRPSAGWKRRRGGFGQTLQLCGISRARQEKRVICRLPRVSSPPANISLAGSSSPVSLPHSSAHTAACLSLPINASHFCHWAI